MARPGIYYRGETDELTRVESGASEPQGDGWQLLSDDPSTGLLAARALIVERGLRGEAAAIDVYWHLPQQSVKNCRLSTAA